MLQLSSLAQASCLLPTLIPKTTSLRSLALDHACCNTYFPGKISVATVAWKSWDNWLNSDWIWGLFIKFKERILLSSVALVKNLCLGGGVISPVVKPPTVVLLNGHVIEVSPKYLCLYLQTWSIRCFPPQWTAYPQWRDT